MVLQAGVMESALCESSTALAFLNTEPVRLSQLRSHFSNSYLKDNHVYTSKSIQTVFWIRPHLLIFTFAHSLHNLNWMALNNGTECGAQCLVLNWKVPSSGLWNSWTSGVRVVLEWSVADLIRFLCGWMQSNPRCNVPTSSVKLSQKSRGF